jgi:glycerophosphoryl diester phosphodiesterase
LSAPGWLTARPIAHRGLHGGGLVENTVGAARAAVERGFALECDVQLSADGEAMVFHDWTLDRLTEATGPVAAKTSTELQAVRMRGTAEPIPTLRQLLATIAGQVPLFVEVKSRFDGAPRLVEAVGRELTAYLGPVAVMSFDPKVVEAAHALRPPRPVGIVAEVFGDTEGWAGLSAFDKWQLTNLNHAYATRPDFVAYNVKHLPSIPAETLKAQRGLPILTWTVRSEADREVAAKHADQVIVEGFVP